jgi:transcriptional regulator with XRE-family HTH domain
MPQRLSGAHGLRRLARIRWSPQEGDDANKRRPVTYRWAWNTPYRVSMGDASEHTGETWGGYLRRMTSRDGWSVARLARQSGIHRGTIFKWIKGVSGVNVASVRAIADALGEDPNEVLRAAAGSVVDDDHPDPEEEYVRTHPKLSDDMKVRIIRLIRERRAVERQAGMDQTRRLVELMEREAG